jgi:hypothetical protein
MKKSILIDASSAILLFKSGWMAPLMENYRVGTGPAAFREMTVANYPGASAFLQWQQEERLVLHPQCPPELSVRTDRNGLDPGERECISLFLNGSGAFVVIDDGPGAAFCRREAIPYVNALLIPRLLSPASATARVDAEAAMRQIFAIGRYAPWVLEYALTCPLEDLTFFLPRPPAD